MLELGGLGGGEVERFVDPADPRSGGPDDPGPLPRGAGDGLEEVGRGGLAVRPGDAEHPHLVRRRAVEPGGDRTDRAPDPNDSHLRHRNRERAVDEECDGAVTHRGGRMVVAVVGTTADAAEQRAARDAATVVGDVRHVDVRVPGELEHGGVVEEGVQVHGILSVTERGSQRYWPAGPQPGPGVAAATAAVGGVAGVGWRMATAGPGLAATELEHPARRHVLEVERVRS